MGIFEKKERDKWQLPAALVPRQGVGLPALDPAGRNLYEHALPRNVLLPRFQRDRPPTNYWMRPYELLQNAYLPGQIILGKLAGQFLGQLDDRPMVTTAGARAGKTTTILEPNLCLYPGSCLVLDPKGELTERTALLRHALGHRVIVLDPFGQSGLPSHAFNALDELDPKSLTIIDDVGAIAQALIVDDGGQSRHWNDSAKMLLQGIILLTLLLPKEERNLVTVRLLLTLAHPRFLALVARKRKPDTQPDDEHFVANRAAVETLLKLMANQKLPFGGVLSSIGNRFLATPAGERGSIFSTASAQTDFLDSLALRRISQHSDFGLADLRGNRPTTIYLCLPVGYSVTHYRWLRLIVQMACTVLEKMGRYPRDRAPILFMMEEFATLGHMDIMERAAAYFPGFGVKLWAILQDVTQLKRYYSEGWETFLGNAGLVQCFANGDQATLNYIASRMENLAAPFELRQIFSRKSGHQLLMFEGEPPAAALRLDHQDVESIYRTVARAAASRYQRRRGN